MPPAWRCHPSRDGGDAHRQEAVEHGSLDDVVPRVAWPLGEQRRCCRERRRLPVRRAHPDGAAVLQPGVHRAFGAASARQAPPACACLACRVVWEVQGGCHRWARSHRGGSVCQPVPPEAVPAVRRAWRPARGPGPRGGWVCQVVGSGTDDRTEERGDYRPDRFGDDPPAEACCRHRHRHRREWAPARQDAGVQPQDAVAALQDVPAQQRLGVQACGPVERLRASWKQSPARAGQGPEPARWDGPVDPRPAWLPRGVQEGLKEQQAALGVPRAWLPWALGLQDGALEPRAQLGVMVLLPAWLLQVWLLQVWPGPPARWRPVWVPGEPRGWRRVLWALSSRKGWPSAAELQARARSLPGSHCRRS